MKGERDPSQRAVYCVADILDLSRFDMLRAIGYFEVNDDYWNDPENTDIVDGIRYVIDQNLMAINLD